MYRVKIVADTIGARTRSRITTFEIEMPKWLVAEFNTHRMLCRNSASSRAIPTSTIIQRVMDDPVIPLDFRAKNTGMQATTVLDQEEYRWMVERWLIARNASVAVVRQMLEHGDGVDKQRVNRLLEPWMKTVIVATATEWENFFTLRNSVHAQPEFGYIAQLMQVAYETSKPQAAYWHYPYLDTKEFGDAELDKVPDIEGLHKVNAAMMLVSAARCGRVSYYRQGETQTLEKDIERGLSFAENKHWSPLEHTACEEQAQFYGPLFGWKSLRKFFPGESGSSRQPTDNRPTFLGIPIWEES